MGRRNKSATLKEVAAIAGVSIKTVSNVVNDWPYVTEETRLKVLQAIEAVGYRPNFTARSLVTGKTNTIGVLIPDISNPFFGTAMRGCEDVLFEGGYSLLLCNTNEDIQREQYNLNMLISRGVDALILWGMRTSCADLEAIAGPAVPLVTIELGDCPISPNHTSINIDSFTGAFDATSHLIAQGCTRIAHLAGPLGRVTAERRILGYQKALESNHLPFQPEFVYPSAPTIIGGYEAALPVLQDNPPQAIFCYNDLIAAGVLMAARQLQLNIPADLKVVGFDDIAMTSLTEPTISTVRIEQRELGRLAGQIVLDRLCKSQEHPNTLIYPVQLNVRGSSDPNYVLNANMENLL